MNNSDFFNILENPAGINEQQTKGLKNIVNEFPYFQAARVLYLKGLKNEGSYQYNKELKQTAAHTTDRSILFDYITSKSFNQNLFSKKNIEEQEELKNIEVFSPEEITSFKSETSNYDEHVLSSDLFEEKTTENSKEIAKENLAIGSPLEFNTNETHSFQEWLKISVVPIIEREEIKEENKKASKSKQELINNFIISKPKIAPVKKTVSLKNLAQENSFNANELMTETLAKVYLEQKNYKKAIQAYRILSLKYPEKNSYFADRIQDLKEIDK